MSLFSRFSGHEFDVDVELSHVAGVLLKEVKEKSLQRSGLCPGPSLARLITLNEIMPANNLVRARRPGIECHEKRRKRVEVLRKSGGQTSDRGRSGPDASGTPLLHRTMRSDRSSAFVSVAISCPSSMP